MPANFPFALASVLHCCLNLIPFLPALRCSSVGWFLLFFPLWIKCPSNYVPSSMARKCYAVVLPRA